MDSIDCTPDWYEEDADLYSDELLSYGALLERVCIPVEPEPLSEG